MASMVDRRRVAGWIAASVAAAPLLMRASAHAEPFPVRRMVIVVPYTPGSGFDFVARTIGQKITERLGPAVMIDNKPGASGSIGTEAVANAEPDGYTLMVSGTPHTVSPAIGKNLRYDPIASFSPIVGVATSGLALVINPNVFPVATVQEFLAEVRARPGMLNHSSPGAGTLQHLGMELLKQQVGLKAVHVPYRGASLALTDLLTGQVHFTFLPVHSARPHARMGKLRMLAVASARRSPFAPDVPTFAEAGLPSMDFELWYAVFGPSKLPSYVIEKLEDEIANIIELPDVKESFARQGMTASFRNARAIDALMKEEVARWSEVAEKAGLKPE
jgi:tripartite-type tricarboxylate transporter receptor subunit TctC